MKNTVKKILALVFAVVMVCSLAVPALAADETLPVKVTLVDNKGDVIFDSYTVNVPKSRANVKKALDLVEADAKADFTVKNGKLTAVDAVKSGVEYFETDAWYVTVNGKLVSDDLSTVAVAKNNEIVIYWGDVALNSKLAQFSASNINKGIVEFFYYDATGAKQPLTKATVAITGVYNELDDSEVFVTDEKGQIWIAPQYLDDAATYTIASVEIAAAKTKLDPEKDDKDEYKAEKEYFDEFGALNLVKTEVAGKTIEVKANMYETAGATGDMTMVYVLVAAAAVVTLAAVVVMKKKSVKAN